MTPSRDDDPAGQNPVRDGSPERGPKSPEPGTDANGRETAGEGRAGATADGRAETRSSDEAPPAHRKGPPAHREGPPAQRARDDKSNEGTGEEGNWTQTFLVDVGSSMLSVLLVGFFVFAVSGVWPPLVAVESGSMTPHLKTGDLVFVMDDERFPGEGAHDGTGVVTARTGADTGYRSFGGPGDVVVYKPDGNGNKTPIIHRAMFWVEDGENWYDEADKSALGGADSCAELSNCPAPHAGFITKGDANPTYDQVGFAPHSSPVKPAWIVGTAELRFPEIGCLRLPSESCGPLKVSSAGDALAVDV